MNRQLHQIYRSKPDRVAKHAIIETNDARLTTIKAICESVIAVNGDKITATHQLLPNDRFEFGFQSENTRYVIKIKTQKKAVIYKYATGMK